MRAKQKCWAMQSKQIEQTVWCSKLSLREWRGDARSRAYAGKIHAIAGARVRIVGRHECPAAQPPAPVEAAEAGGLGTGAAADAAALAGAAAVCGALAALSVSLLALSSVACAASAALAAFASAISARCLALMQSSTMRRPALTLSSIDLVAIWTMSVSPLTSSRRTARVVDSTGFMIHVDLPLETVTNAGCLELFSMWIVWLNS